jgi:hypothetical protein
LTHAIVGRLSGLGQDEVRHLIRVGKVNIPQSWRFTDCRQEVAREVDRALVVRDLEESMSVPLINEDAATEITTSNVPC